MHTRSSTRRALLGAGLALPFVGKALADDAFRHRAEQWRPRYRAPQRWLMKFDPNGRLSSQLISLYLFEQLGSTIDYARPYASELTASGTSIAFTPSIYGGNQVSTGGNSSDFVNIPAPIVTLGSHWTISWLGKWDGTSSASYTGPLITVGDGAQLNGIGVNNSLNTIGTFGGAQSANFTAPLMSGLNGWHRMTIGTDATNCFCYLDGVLSDTETGAGPSGWSPAQIAVGWPWPIADVFMWNRALTASDVLTHYSDPYGTTMIPTGQEFLIKGQVSTAKKPSLLTVGVGP